MEINHFTHEHPLVLSEEKFNTRFPCNVCGEPIFGVSYCCLLCPCVLHHWCAELPRELSSHSCHPDHPLVLGPSPTSLSFCVICGLKTSCGYVYSCQDECAFTLHVYCALFPDPSMFELPGVKSELTLHVPKDRKIGKTCLICRHDVDGAVLFPNDGRPMYYHFQCVMLPRVVKHDRHLHELTLRLPLDEKDKFFEFFCNVCEEERNPDDYVYYCEPCEVAGHIGCGISGWDRPVQDVISNFPVYKLSESEEAANKVKLDELDSPNYQFGSKEEAQKNEETDLPPVDVLYCPKEHPLVLVKYTRTIRVVCAGCALYISGLTYSCEECSWYIHKRCTELPKEINHSMHSDHGSLQLISPDIVFCEYCSAFFESSTPAFRYGCLECDFNLDTSCGLHPDNQNHPSHKHALTPVIVSHSPDEDEGRPYYDSKLSVRRGKMPSCQACGLLCEHLTLECESCNFYLHVFCSLLPLTGKHTRHRHELSLTYSYKEDPNALEFFCDTCEKPRIPNRWVYYCPDPNCVIVSHIECVDPDIFNTCRVCKNVESCNSLLGDEIIMKPISGGHSAQYPYQEVILHSNATDTFLVD